MAEQPRMHWLKLWTRGWLEGSIRFDLTPAQRSVFLDLCALARESRNPPWVQANETTAYPHHWLASKLNIPLELLEETLRICEEQKRVSENDTGIKVLKFQYYQSERPLKKQVKEPKGENELATISRLYEENIGILTPVAADRLRDIAGTYPPEWFSEALKEAVALNHRNLKYIEAILERWKVEGFKAPKSKMRRPGKVPTDEELDQQEKERGLR